MAGKVEVPRFSQVLIKKTIGGKWTAEMKIPDDGVQSRQMEYATFDEAVAYIKETFDV